MFEIGEFKAAEVENIAHNIECVRKTVCTEENPGECDQMVCSEYLDKFIQPGKSFELHEFDDCFA